MYLDNFVLETTRRCNMVCNHCLRGEPQNLSMPPEHIRTALSKIDFIGSVTFTGGEPFLPSGLRTINLFIDQAHYFDVEVANFYIATNGLRWRNEIVETVKRLYWMCDPDNEISSVDISTDRFHMTGSGQTTSYHNFKYRLEEALLYEHGIELQINEKSPNLDYNSAIPEGRAENWGTEPKEPSEIIWHHGMDEHSHETQVVEDEIYLNCKGNIIHGCNWSYASQDLPENIICHVNDDIEDAIRKRGTFDPEY